MNSTLSIADLCHELGLQQQFVLGLADDAECLYTVYHRPKRSGGARRISASQGRLKRVQRLILDGVLSKFEMPPHVHGCVKGRSIVSNAAPHVDQDVVLKIDLSDFFGAVSFERVIEIFRQRFDFDAELAQTLAFLTTYKNCLPQGAPTSPALANFAALDLDEKIMELCTAIKPAQFGYSRYVDDITISGGEALIEILPQIYETIEKCGFQANSSKTRILRKSTRQFVTGVVVNKKTNPPRKLIRKVRQHLFYCKKFGLEDHCKERGIKSSNFLRQITGYIGYIGVTQPDLADQFVMILHNLLPNFEMGEEEKTMRFLKSMIDTERMARFTYEDVERHVAPAEITVEDDGLVSLRAFQIAPEQRWLIFNLSLIKDLKIEGS